MDNLGKEELEKIAAKIHNMGGSRGAELKEGYKHKYAYLEKSDKGPARFIEWEEHDDGTIKVIRSSEHDSK